MWELVISWKKLLNFLVNKNAQVIRIKWSHVFLKYNNLVTTIPLHSSTELPIWTLKKIMKDLSLNREDIVQAKR